MRCWSAAAADGAAAASRALRLEPRRASNHQRRANALVMRARLDAPPTAAAATTGAAAALADSADRAFGEARRLAPADALILVDQARGQLVLRRPEPALATARRIVALYPAAATGHALEAAALLSLGRGEEGREALLRARDARWEDGSGPQRRAVEGMLRALERGEGGGGAARLRPR